MNKARLEYSKLAPEGLNRLRGVEHYLNTDSGVPVPLLELVRLRCSLLNGCEYCIHLHSAELRKSGETPERIAGVQNWRGTSLYTERERAALAWAEALTNIQEGHAPDVVYDEVRKHLSDAEIVNLTLAISSINAWNRLAIALGSHSSAR